MLTPLAYFNACLRSAFYRRRIGCLLFGWGLVIAAGIFLWPVDHSSQAAGSPHTVPTDRLMISNMSQPTAEHLESVPSLSPTLPPLLTPTPLPIPTTGLVWGKNAAGVYLWQAPEGKILTRLPNGIQVNYLDERSSYGNLPWIKVSSANGDGWVLQNQVFRKNKRPAAYVAIDQGTFLRDQPRGGVQQALSRGTPIMKILDAKETEGRTWVQVEVLDGAIGWVAKEWLSTELPVGENAD